MARGTWFGAVIVAASFASIVFTQSREESAQRPAAALSHDARLGRAAARREVGGRHRRRAGARRHRSTSSTAASTNSCAGRTEAPILKYDASGKLLKTLGRGHVRLPARRDRRSRRQPLGHRRARRERQGPPGLQVQSRRQGADDARQGRRVSGSGPDLFDQPTDVVVAPNGDIFVTDSHRNGKNNRVVKFTKDGTFIKEWGKKGSGRGEISEPHTIAMDSRGRLFVGDRENNRIQIFDQDGKYLDEWRQFGRPSGIYITKDDTIYVADSESGPDTGAHELPGHQERHPHRQRQGRQGDGVHRGHGIDHGRSLRRRRRRRRCAGQRLRRRGAAPDARAAREEVVRTDQ